MSSTKVKHPAKTAAAKTGSRRRAATGSSLPFAPESAASPGSAPRIVPRRDTTKPVTTADVAAAYAAPDEKSASNALGDTTQSLQTFSLTDLAQYTKEGAYSTTASKDVHLFYVGRDDVHDILKYVLSRVSNSLYLNMFGFDDSELNNILMQKALDPSVTMLITLDLSQSKGVHEAALIAADQKYNLAAYNTHFTLGESATHQISHTKGFVADGRVAAEGSVNWSSSGEGTFVVTGQPGGPGYAAQNNTQSVITDPDTINRFQTELISEHMTAKSQEAATGVGQASIASATPARSTAANPSPGTAV
jgi:hypothetical protein